MSRAALLNCTAYTVSHPLSLRLVKRRTPEQDTILRFPTSHVKSASDSASLQAQR